MQDDATRGASAPIEADSSAWQGEHGVDRDEGASLAHDVRVGLTAVVLSVRQEQPVALVNEPATGRVTGVPWALPAGRFSPLEQPSLETALRDVVLECAGRELGYVEQLLTDYGPSDECAAGTQSASRQLSVSYLALSRADTMPLAGTARWLDCYELLPWEDFRGGRPSVLPNHILPGLDAWCGGSPVDPQATGGETPMSRRERVAVSFGLSGRSWDDQRVVDRFDLVLEAGLLPSGVPSTLAAGHLRLVAAGLGRLRAKIRYRPVVFELLPPEFTLFELQRTVEAVLGPTLHKQNFRRLVEGTGLVEPTGDVRNNTGGRPAKTFRFRREVLLERPAPGVHVRAGRAA